MTMSQTTQTLTVFIQQGPRHTVTYCKCKLSYTYTIERVRASVRVLYFILIISVSQLVPHTLLDNVTDSISHGNKDLNSALQPVSVYSSSVSCS